LQGRPDGDIVQGNTCTRALPGLVDFFKIKILSPFSIMASLFFIIIQPANISGSQEGLKLTFDNRIDNFKI